MTQKKRTIPPHIASKLNQKQLDTLQTALDDFDNNYNSLMKRLAALKAPKIVYFMVNGAIKATMLKSRSDVDLSDQFELELWATGYNRTTELMEDLSDPAGTAREGFTQAKMLKGVISYDAN
ncbi:hypothetical protein QGP82_18735 [Leptothoe sp. LEGE 181152]|nr:hypothetical protein [Leptothoe sp. LEGE 181152]